ncbi:MAG: CotH kinase family protein [Prevotella sp.]|nr:CotH kinase family protein [Prevotella sp.]
MKKNILSFLLSVIALTLQAQIYVNGHIAPFDSKTNTWLATIAENQFGKDNQLPVSLQDGWNKIVIDGNVVNSQYTFKQVNAKSRYETTVTDTKGNTIKGNIQFTFLPVVYLEGLFGYDYQRGTVTITIPNEQGNDYVLSGRIKWRGKTTNTNDKHKRNYNIKLDTDTQLFDMRKDNNWMLDAGQPDVFRMRNRIAMDIWNDMASKPYYADKEPKARNGVRGYMVEVFLNNEYRGIYNLSEKLDRKQMKLKKVDESGNIHGVLYKGITWDDVSMNDSIYNYDNYANNLLGYEVKYPEPYEDCDSTDWKPLVDANNNIIILCYNDEEFEKQIEQWLDVPVMIDYSIFLSSVNALDNSGKNMFWAIYDKETSNRMTLAPWDLDLTFGQRWGGILATEKNDHTSPEYFTDVVIAGFFNFHRTNALHYNDRLNERYQELRQNGNVLSTESLIERFTKYYNAIKNSGAAQRETDKWSGDSDIWGEEINFDKEYEYICDWITKHLEAVDKKGFPVLYDKEYMDSIFARIDNKIIINKSDNHVYTLSGQRINSTNQLKHGVYIVNRKKVIY